MLDSALAITASAAPAAAVMLYQTIHLDQGQGAIRHATLRATAHGIYEARIDGRPVTDALMAPGWTAYEWRLQVQEHDVTELVSDGAVIEVTLSDGWYRGDLGFENAHANYGSTCAFLAELVIEYDDGSTQTLVTDTGWKARESEHTRANIYDGQTTDARMRHAHTPALTVVESSIDRSTLVPQIGPLVRRQSEISPVKIWQSPSGKTLVDYGQNLVGWIRLRARGESGATVTLRHAEVLENEELGIRPLRSARAVDEFILSGEDDVFEPTLTFHGFRYVEITGYPGEVNAADIPAIVVHSDMAPSGRFETSHPLLNQLISNSFWSQRGNFLDVPTDCPQRDERLGWTGDIAAYARTATQQFDVADFLHKWMLDVEEEARAAGPGGVPHVVPDLLKYANFPSGWENIALNRTPTCVWGDAAVWVPEALWEAYGDRERLAAHYPAMVLHLESVIPCLSETGLWDTGFQFGDWLDPDASPHAPDEAKADRGVVATACLYRSARFAAETANILGLPSDADRWQRLAEDTREAFLSHYVSSEGRVRSDCATVYALAIAFGLLDGETRDRAGERLAEIVAEREYRITTGFAGTPYVTWALSETGHTDVAYRLLLEEQCPSWLYPVTMGATTIWERWDSMLPDGSINPGEMTSFNHYALGAVADWIYQVVIGIRAAEPGYARVLIQPVPGDGLDWARGTLTTPAGEVQSGWRRDGDAIVVEASIPEGVSADIVLPDGSRHEVTGGSHRYRVA